MNPSRLRTAVRKCLELEGFEVSAEVSIVLVDDVRMQELNRQYRGLDRPTDVMAFSQLEGDGLQTPGSATVLGDVVISVDTAQRQADENAHSLDEELSLLLIHGTLHLLGYDDETDAGALEMRQRENTVLSVLKNERRS